MNFGIPSFNSLISDFKSLKSPFPEMKEQTKEIKPLIKIQIDFIYEENKVSDLIQKENSFRLFSKSSTILIEKEKLNSELDKRLSALTVPTKSGAVYILKFNYFADNIDIKQVTDCIELLINSEYKIDYTHNNIIQYLKAFTIFDIRERQDEAISQLLIKLNNENIIYFIKYVQSLYESSLSSHYKQTHSNGNLSLDYLLTYTYWLASYLVVKTNNIAVIDISTIKFDKYCFDSIIKFNAGRLITFTQSSISIEKDELIYKVNPKEKESNGILSLNTIKCSLLMLKQVKLKYKEVMQYYYKENEYFNTGRVTRTRSSEGIINDYPHYYQLKLDNDPDLQMFAVRLNENSNFILSRSKANFNKHSEDYIGEIEANFWGTQFDIYDNGSDKALVEKIGTSIVDERRVLGKIIYETNIMGECPRYFRSELFTVTGQTQNGTPIIQKHDLKNLEPEWNVRMNCYCLNFYGRVKKASARNFQMIYPDDRDSIILQHGKENSNEFNIDFREPFNYVTAFAHSLVSIGRKRVVS